MYSKIMFRLQQIITWCQAVNNTYLKAFRSKKRTQSSTCISLGKPSHHQVQANVDWSCRSKTFRAHFHLWQDYKHCRKEFGIWTNFVAVHTQLESSIIQMSLAEDWLEKWKVNYLRRCFERKGCFERNYSSIAGKKANDDVGLHQCSPSANPPNLAHQHHSRAVRLTMFFDEVHHPAIRQYIIALLLGLLFVCYQLKAKMFLLY